MLAPDERAGSRHESRAGGERGCASESVRVAVSEFAVPEAAAKLGAGAVVRAGVYASWGGPE